MRTREEIREKQRRYDSDVYYEVWRSGGNSDRINEDRVRDAYYNGLEAESAAAMEIKRQCQKEEEQAENQLEEQ